MANFYLDICLSDIPKERIKTASNGKKYLKAIIDPRKAPDSDGYDHYIAAFVPREQRNDGEGPAFIGRAQLKEYTDGKQASTYSGYKGTDNAKPANDNGDDLPF